MQNEEKAALAAEDLRYQRLLDTVGIPVALRKVTLEKVKTPSAKEFLEWYFERGKDSFDRGDGIFIAGKSYSGKSAIAAMLLLYCMSAGVRGRFLSAQDLLRSLARQEVLPDDVTVEDKCLKTGLLVIDDLGTEHCVLPGRGTMVSDIISRRIVLAKPCIVTTSLPRKDLETIYGQKFTNAIDGDFHKIALLGSFVSEKRLEHGLFGQ